MICIKENYYNFLSKSLNTFFCHTTMDKGLTTHKLSMF